MKLGAGRYTTRLRLCPPAVSRLAARIRGPPVETRREPGVMPAVTPNETPPSDLASCMGPSGARGGGRLPVGGLVYT